MDPPSPLKTLQSCFSVFLPSKPVVLFFCEHPQNGHIWMSHVTYPSNWPLSFAYSQWPPGLCSHHRGVQGLCSVKCATLSSEMPSTRLGKFQGHRSCLHPSLTAKCMAHPSHAGREAMMGLFLLRTMPMFDSASFNKTSFRPRDGLPTSPSISRARSYYKPPQI